VCVCVCVSDILFLIYCINSSFTAYQVNTTYPLTTVVNRMYKEYRHPVGGSQIYVKCIKLYLLKAEKIDVIFLMIYKTVCSGKRVPFWGGGGGVPFLNLETKAEKITMKKSCRELDSVFRRQAFTSEMISVSFKRAKSDRSVSTRDQWNQPHCRGVFLERFTAKKSMYNVFEDK